MYHVFNKTCLTLAAAALELSWSPLRSQCMGNFLQRRHQANVKPFAKVTMRNQRIVIFQSRPPRLCAHIAFARDFSVSWGTGATATSTNGACDASKRPHSARKQSFATKFRCHVAVFAMLPRLRRHRRRANERCDWPKAAIDRRGVSTRSGPKQLVCEILTLSEHDIAIDCDIANHLPCTADRSKRDAMLASWKCHES